MADFSISDVAFTGFRIISQRPKAFGIWVAIQVAIALVTGFAMVAAVGPAFIQFQDTPHPDPTQAMAFIGHMAPFFLLMMLVALVIYPVIYAALNRAVLRPEDERFAYLRWGADEFRQLGLMLLYGLVLIGVYIGLVIAALIVGLIGAALAGAAKLAAAGPIIAGVLAAIIYVGGLLLVAVRLSLASPLTFATGRIDLFGSWKLTKGKFWPLLGVAIVVFFVTLVIYLVLGVVSLAVYVAAGGGFHLNDFMHPDMSTVGAYFTPARIITRILTSAVGTLMMPLWLTPPAAIYARLAGTAGYRGADGAPIQDVFG